MCKGVVFDIQELCVHDGPGVRTAVFLKGCTMRCAWCHNPEGLLALPELLRGAGCMRCGRCDERENSLSPEEMERAARACPVGCLRVAGRVCEAAELAAELLRQKESLALMGGGITLSGGECLLQGEFALSLLRRLRGMHRAIETSGYADSDVFCAALCEAELVLFDIKHMDDAVHRRFTGVGNELIQANLTRLIDSGHPFIARIPMIPGVNDDAENLTNTARRLRGAKGLLRVELLPYNTNAGAKYALANRRYEPGFDTDSAPALENADVFSQYRIERVVL